MKRQLYPGRGRGGAGLPPPQQQHQPPMAMGRYGNNNGGGMINNILPPNTAFNMRQNQQHPPFQQPQGPPPRGSFRGGGRGFRGGGNAGPGHRPPPPPPPAHLQFQQQPRQFQQQRQQTLPPPPPPPPNGQQQSLRQQPVNHAGHGNYGGPPGPQQFGNGRGRGGRNTGRGGPGSGRGRIGGVDGRGNVGLRPQQNPRISQPWQQGPPPPPPPPPQMQQQPPNGPFPPPSFAGRGAPSRQMPPPPPPLPPPQQQQQNYQPQHQIHPMSSQSVQQFQQIPQLSTQNSVNDGPRVGQHQLPHHQAAPVQTPVIPVMRQYQSQVTNVNSHPISGSTFHQNPTRSIAINSGSAPTPSTSLMANSSTFIYPPPATTNAPVTTTPGAQTITTQTKSGSSAVGATPTIQQIDAAWEEHTAPSGVSYYYNSILKESTFTMPAALRNRKTTSGNGVQSQRLSQLPSASPASASKSVWREYEDAKTGMKYYSDGVTTSWEKPEGFNAGESDLGSNSLESKKDAINIQSHHESFPSQEPSKKKQKMDNHPRKESFKNKSDALDAFKKLLKSKNVSPILKWNEVVRLCQKSSTWVGCEDILSVGERKQALSEYQTSRANELRNEQREQINRAKEAFHNLLMEVVPTIRGFSARSSRFEDVREILSKDDRFDSVKDEATRESLFLDFCDEQQKREERQKRSRKKEAQDAFISFLKEKEEKGILSYASTWGSFLASLTETDKSDTRFSTSVSLTDSDRQVFFADHVIELQKIEDDKRRRIREARRNAERAQRASYGNLLHQLAVDGKIFPYSRWRGEVQELVSKEISFAPLYGQDRNAPRAMFEEFVEEWYETYQRERSLMRRRLESLLKDRSVDVSSLITTETTYTSFKDLLADDRKGSYSDSKEMWEIINGQNPVSSALVFYKDLKSRAKTGSRPSISKPISRRSLRQDGDESSEDEGEIVEDVDENTQAQASTNPAAAAELTGENKNLDETKADIAIVENPEHATSKPEIVEGQKDVKDTVQEIVNISNPGSVEASTRTVDNEFEPPSFNENDTAAQNSDNRPVLLDKDDDAVITYGLLQTAEPYFDGSVKTCLRTSSRDSTKGMHFCCELRSEASSVMHIKNRGNWDCGFRNLQMMLSALLPNLQANHNIFKYVPLRRPVSIVPTVTQLESSLEEAWAEGFDPKGAEHYCHKILDRQSWIGTMEVASLLWYFGIDATVVQFIDCQESRDMLPKFVKAYFSKALDRGGCPFNSNCIGSNPHAKALLDIVTVQDKITVTKSCSCHLLPLYLQWEGHSVTIVGIEEDGTFLVYDPSKNGQKIQRDLTSNRSFSPLRLNSVAEVSTKDLLNKDTQIILCTLQSLPNNKRRKIPAVITAANDVVVKER